MMGIRINEIMNQNIDRRLPTVSVNIRDESSREMILHGSIAETIATTQKTMTKSSTIFISSSSDKVAKRNQSNQNP